MQRKPSYQELEKRVLELETDLHACRKGAEPPSVPPFVVEREAHDTYHDQMEDLVRERTAELTRVNQQLVQEIADRKRAKEALRSAHRELAEKAAILEETNAELSQYAYVVSHDLRSPLRAIRNYADFLQEDLEGMLNDQQKGYLDGLARALRQGEELVTDLLEFANIRTTTASPQPVDLGALLREVISSFHLPAEVEIVMGDEWPTVSSERVLLYQVFQNLISNAVKFNRASTLRIEIGWRPDGEEQYEVSVRDNGIGIDSRYHDQIFRVFQRLHTLKEYDGTGIGLAIVKKAAHKLGGSVRLESKTGEGSTFYVLLPGNPGASAGGAHEQT